MFQAPSQCYSGRVQDEEYKYEGTGELLLSETGVHLPGRKSVPQGPGNQLDELHYRKILWVSVLGGPYNFTSYLVFFSVIIWAYLVFLWLLSLKILGWIFFFHQIPRTCLELWDLNRDFKAYVTEIHLGGSWEQFNWEASNPSEKLKLKLKSHSHGETFHIVWKAVDRNKAEVHMWS